MECEIMSEQMREEFEAAYVEDMVRIMGEGIRKRAFDNTKFLMQNGEFQDPALRLALWAWKTSRESLPAAYTAVDMTTAAADGFRDGAASAKAENEALRHALKTIREESSDIGACECAADALADAAMGKEG
jgi:hypothetical protein